ncbi:hypothetical protein ABK040_005571 [Willaertia magna]
MKERRIRKGKGKGNYLFIILIISLFTLNNLISFVKSDVIVPVIDESSCNLNYNGDCSFLDKSVGYSSYAILFPDEETSNIECSTLDDFSSKTLYFGLFYTDASVYQMLRGILVVFTGILAVIFLKQRYYYHHWIGLFLIVGGCVIVGLKSILFKDNTDDNDNAADSVSRNPLLGDLLVIAAQVLAAIQNIVEEKFFSKYDVQPLQAVGWEGYWGVTMTTFVLFILYFIPGSDYGSVENSVYALAQCINNWKIALATLGSILSIAFFNFFGVSITKRISSTSRSTIDTCRTLFIWIVSLIIGWEEFQWLQVIGFVVLVFGTFLFNEVITVPYYHQWYLKRKQLWLEAKEEKERKLKEQCDDVKDSIN